MDDRQIVDMLFARSECALKEVSDKYGALCSSVMRRVLDNFSDIEECSNDVLLAVWNSIPPKRPENLGAYLCILSRNAAINRLKYNNREKRNEGLTLMLSELDESLESVDDDMNAVFERERFRKIINDFLKSLDGQTRVLFIRRYIFFESSSELSQRFDVTENFINVKLHRARKKLKTILEKEDLRI